MMFSRELQALMPSNESLSWDWIAHCSIGDRYLAVEADTDTIRQIYGRCLSHRMVISSMHVLWDDVWQVMIPSAVLCFQCMVILVLWQSHADKTMCGREFDTTTATNTTTAVSSPSPVSTHSTSSATYSPGPDCTVHSSPLALVSLSPFTFTYPVVWLTTNFPYSSRFSAFCRMLFHSRAVHSLMSSSHRFLCLPLGLRPYTANVPCRIVLASPSASVCLLVSVLTLLVFPVG